MSTPMPVADPARAHEALVDNARVAELLREMAALLEAQGDNAYRVLAYRRAAETVAALRRSLRETHDQDGLAGLDALPTVGPGIAAAIAEILQTGRWGRLDRLLGHAGPQMLLRLVPGIGPKLAVRLHDELGVETLAALDAVARDGRLRKLPHVGERRAQAIRAALAQMLDRGRARGAAQAALRRGSEAGPEPPVAMLLAVDDEYREAAAADRLPKIAPQRFNPEGLAWLPVLHTRRGDWHFTVLFSNTENAHRLGRVRDWVVVYAEDAEHHEQQYTVVTANTGPLAGRRVVRGREGECKAHYAPRAPAESPMPAVSRVAADTASQSMR